MWSSPGVDLGAGEHQQHHRRAIGKLFDRFVISPKNNKVAALFVAALKHHVETGEEVGQGVRIDSSTAQVVAV